MSDPYDFEIALPAFSSSPSRSTKSHYTTNDSSEDASDLDDSISNVSSISSDTFQGESPRQEDIVDGHHQAIRPSQTTLTSSPVSSHQSVASESEDYEKESFEDEDSVIKVSASAAAAQLVMDATRNFDYSMDFSDDEDEGHMQLQLPTSQPTQNDAVRPDSTPRDSKSRLMSGQSNSDHENGAQSAFHEPDSFFIVNDDNLKKSVNFTIALKPAFATSEPILETSKSPESPAGSSSIEVLGNMDDLKTPICSVIDTFPAPTAPSSLQKAQRSCKSVTQSHVTIVRVSNEAARIEMKDASTQFTGNHAAIQTDLIPDGMHNLFVPPPPVPIAAIPDNFTRESDASHTTSPLLNQSDRSQLPSESPLLKSCVDAFKLPRATSSSIYKQQLLALQEQILQKKRETERIIQDRMAFQYPSVRGTERVSKMMTERPQRLELWKALMQVDPTLDEQKARTVARLAQDV